MKFILLFIIASFSSFTKENTTQNSKQNVVKFHKAESEAEKTLDSILEKANKDEKFENKLEDCLTKVNYIDTNEKNEFGYTIKKAIKEEFTKEEMEFCNRYFTRDLLKEFRENIIIKFCKDSPSDEGGCFFDSSFFLCGNGGDLSAGLGRLYNEKFLNNDRILLGIFFKVRMNAEDIKKKAIYQKTEEEQIEYFKQKKFDTYETEINKGDELYYIMKKENGIWKIDGNISTDHTTDYYNSKKSTTN